MIVPGFKIKTQMMFYMSKRTEKAFIERKLDIENEIQAFKAHVKSIYENPEIRGGIAEAYIGYATQIQTLADAFAKEADTTKAAITFNMIQSLIMPVRLPENTQRVLAEQEIELHQLLFETIKALDNILAEKKRKRSEGAIKAAKTRRINKPPPAVNFGGVYFEE
jgi:hypothetical protein